jgi:thiol-disulfide isomerase/thioredoxin
MKFSLSLLFLFATVFTAFSGTIEWEESAQYVIEINGKIDVTCKAYSPMSYKPYLILRNDKLHFLLLLDLGSKRIVELQKNAVTPNGDFSITTNDIPSGKKIGEYKLQNKATVFAYAGKNLTIKVKESLVGEVSESIIYAHSPDYGILRDQYKPNKAALDFLKKYNKKTDVVVMFATWCPTCKKVLPRFLRIMKEIKNPNFSMKFIGIAMGGSEPHQLLEKYGHDYPAFIFYQNGKEKTRIIGETPYPLETTMMSIFSK